MAFTARVNLTKTSMVGTIIETIVKFKVSLVTVFFALHLHETVKSSANIM